LSDWCVLTWLTLHVGLGNGNREVSGFEAISVLTMAARWRDLYDAACGDFITISMRATLT